MSEKKDIAQDDVANREINARRERKRRHDALYARQRRNKERVDEDNLIIHCEELKEENARLQNERTLYEAMLADATAKIKKAGLPLSGTVLYPMKVGKEIEKHNSPMPHQPVLFHAKPGDAWCGHLDQHRKKIWIDQGKQSVLKLSQQSGAATIAHSGGLPTSDHPYHKHSCKVELPQQRHQFLGEGSTIQANQEESRAHHNQIASSKNFCLETPNYRWPTNPRYNSNFGNSFVPPTDFFQRAPSSPNDHANMTPQNRQDRLCHNQSSVDDIYAPLPLSVGTQCGLSRLPGACYPTDLRYSQDLLVDAANINQETLTMRNCDGSNPMLSPLAQSQINQTPCPYPSHGFVHSAEAGGTFANDVFQQNITSRPLAQNELRIVRQGPNASHLGSRRKEIENPKPHGDILIRNESDMAAIDSSDFFSRPYF